MVYSLISGMQCNLILFYLRDRILYFQSRNQQAILVRIVCYDTLEFDLKMQLLHRISIYAITTPH